MSSFFDIVISFVAALIAAAFAHFGAADVPESRTAHPSATEAATSRPPMAPETSAAPEATPISAPQRPARTSREPALKTAMREAQAKANEAQTIAHDAQARAHDAKARAIEAMIDASEHIRSDIHLPSASHLSSHLDNNAISGLSQSQQEALNTAMASHLDVTASLELTTDAAECTDPETFRAPSLTAAVESGNVLSL